MNLIKEISLIEYLKREMGNQLVFNISNNDDKYGIKATTILAFKFKEGIVVASDGQATMMPNLMIGFDKFDKLIQIEKHSIIAIAGVPIIAWQFCRLIKSEIKMWNNTYVNKISTNGKVNRLSSILRENIALAQAGLAVEPLFATLEINNEIIRPRIFQFEPAGTYFERDYHASGSGGPMAKTTLFNYFNKSQLPDYKSAIELAIECLISATKIDAATGENFIIKVINKKGVKKVDNEEISKIKDELIRR